MCDFPPNPRLLGIMAGSLNPSMSPSTWDIHVSPWIKQNHDKVIQSVENQAPQGFKGKSNTFNNSGIWGTKSLAYSLHHGPPKVKHLVEPFIAFKL
jgi:hypothetical protein